MSSNDATRILLEERRPEHAGEQGSLSSQTLHGSSQDMETASWKGEALGMDDASSLDYVKVPLNKIQFALVYMSLAFSIFLGSLDQTIITTALPAIAKELKSFDEISWIGTAFLVSCAAFTPFYGKLTDIFGRKFAILTAVTIFEIGSLICGAAPTMNVLIAGRAIAGVGFGGMYSLVVIIVSDIDSLRDRGKFQGIIGAVMGLAAVVGPVLGGGFTDGISWRWCFYINLPLGGIALVIIAMMLRYPPEPRSEEPVLSKLRRIDYLGMALIFGAVVCLQVPLDFGGDKWAWSDWQTITMLSCSAVLFILFGLAQVFAASEPMLPPVLFSTTSLICVFIYAFLYGVSFFGLIYYLPTYFQIVNGDTAVQSGVAVMPFVAGLVVSNLVSGALVSRFGHYKPIVMVGSAILYIGTGLISTYSQYTSRVAQAMFQVIAGIGVGCIMQMRIIAIQSLVASEHMAVGTSIVSFFSTLGGSIGVGIVGAIFKNVLNSQLGPQLSEIVSNSPTSVHQLPQAMLDQALDGFSRAFQTGYKALIPTAGLIIVCLIFVKPAPTGRGDKRESVAVFAD
ncbi:hypothetical protein HK105_203991 [Polyrhizophydium stewartii]|uniref:Major facilitator superfamily (MFS) profile domain-containing protein n=1 Tax=Polyrhizophydium stewartii TaxID=2732419 RepID=A0ABR4NAJ6_9FUNG|nr:hypothetical protein HK105_001352 [Polyrhizophydium stewartii]